MDLTKLQKTTSRAKKRVGRGYGSGKGGHTSGRGQKGQKSRSSLPLWFEGGQLPQIRRFPFIRGKGRMKSLKGKTVVVKLEELNQFKAGTVINRQTLSDAGIITKSEARSNPVKVLNQGEIKVSLTVELPVSEQAAKKIKQAGGSLKRGQDH